MDPAAHERPGVLPPWVRPVLAVFSGAVFVAVLVPPLATLAARYEFAEAVQFSMLAIVVPALLVLGAPWRWLRLGGRLEERDPSGEPRGRDAPDDTVPASHVRRGGLARSLAVLIVEIAIVAAARTTPVVDALATHRAYVILEAVCLVAAGAALWLELVDSPPFRPTLVRPMRIAFAALVMWSIWITAYLVGMAHGSVYRDYHRLPGVGLSFAADQEIAAFVLWAVALAAYVPVIFWNLMAWLRAEENPDEELHRLVREDRRRSWPQPGGDSPGAPRTGPTVAG